MVKRICLFLISLGCVFSLCAKSQENNYLCYSFSKLMLNDNRDEIEQEYNEILSIDKDQGVLEDMKVMLLSNEQQVFLNNMRNNIYNQEWKQATLSVPRVSYIEDMKAIVLKVLDLSDSVENKKKDYPFYDEYINIPVIDFEYIHKIDRDHKITSSASIDDYYMRNLIRKGRSKDSLATITLFEGEIFKNQYDSFPPYWYILGSHYLNHGNLYKAKVCFNQFESLPYIKGDAVHINLIKKKIAILLYENPLLNKSEIFSLLKTMESYAFNQDYGVNEYSSSIYNTFFSKVYFLLDEVELAKKSVANALKTNPDNSDAINMDKLLKGLEEGSLYNTMWKFYDVDICHVREEDEIMLHSMIKKGLYITVPPAINDNYTITLTINGERKVPKVWQVIPGKNLYYFDQNIKGLKKTLNIDIKFTSNVYSTSTTLSYSITPLSNTFSNKLLTILNRSGIDDISYISSIELNDGVSTIIDYDLSIDDKDKELKNIIKRIEKENKKENCDEPEMYVKSRAKDELQKKLLQDVIGINALYKKTTSRHSKETLRSTIHEVGNEKFVITLKSIK